MSPTAQELAAAASDSYKNRLQSEIDDKGMLVHFGGRKYSVFAYRTDPATGFHATAYREAGLPHNIIIAYRGTDPDIRHHTRTTVQDAVVDFVMVRDQVNPQEAEASAFTREVLDKAQALGISRDHVTVTGHSLGGTLAEIEAFRFGLRGVTFNAYGAADLGYGVPAGGDAVTNYVMAGDVVSAASRHFGRTITLASEADIASLRAARYLDAPLGAPPPNPLLAMRLSDHGNANFLPAPDNADPLGPGNLAQAEARYAAHREAIDRFRGDVATDRAELAAALGGTLETTWAGLSPRMREQLVEYHAHAVDAPIHAAVEHNPAVDGIERGLLQYRDAILAGGRHAQRTAAQVADRLHAAGQTMQRQTDELSRGATAFMPVAPLVVGGAAFGAEIAGHMAGSTADGYAGASQLAGTASRAGSVLVAGQLETARDTVEAGAQLAARMATQVVHTQESALARVVDRVLDVREDLAHAADATRQIVTRGIEAVEHAADHVHDALRHPESALNPEARDDTPMQHGANALRPLGDPAHPQHALHAKLAGTMPSCTSAARLAQATAACHAHDITADNLRHIHIDGKAMTFAASSPPWAMARADLTQPPPTVQQSLQHMQALDQQRTHRAAPFQAQQAQMGQQEVTRGASMH